MTKSINLQNVIPTVKSGSEPLMLNSVPLNHSLLDFWRWSTSDLLSNATRGVLAEFIVATALGVDLNTPRTEWDAYDLVTPEGIKVEVKSAAYLQSWKQEKLSKISFSIANAKAWDSSTNHISVDKLRSAHVYVFCLLHHTEKSTVDPLNLDQWVFYVLATSELNSQFSTQKSLSISSLNKIATPVPYDQIRSAVASAAEWQIEL